MKRFDRNVNLVTSTVLSAVLLIGCGTHDESTVDSNLVESNEGQTDILVDDVLVDDVLADSPQAAFETVSYASLTQQVQKIANSHLTSLKGSSMTPQWTEQAAYDNEVRVLYRPDVEGPAYYELAVKEGGFVIVSTGTHDDLVPHFSSEGHRITDNLISQAKARGNNVARFYKLDVLVYVAEDADENIVASIGPNGLEATKKNMRSRIANTTEEVDSWKELKREYGNLFASEIEQVKKEVTPIWNAFAEDSIRQRKQNKRVTPGDEGIDVSEVMWIPHYELVKTIQYNQEYPDVIDNCASGCGPVAWAIIASFIDYVAEEFGNTGDEMGDYYLNELNADKLVGQAPNRAFPFDDHAKNMILEIRSAVKTFCMGGLGATAPWDMGGFEDWANEQGATLSVKDLWLLGQDIQTENWIKDGRPVLLGIGFFEHYVVAIGWGLTTQKFLWLDVEVEYVYANFGWGGVGNGWIENRPFYAGTIE